MKSSLDDHLWEKTSLKPGYTLKPYNFDQQSQIQSEGTFAWPQYLPQTQISQEIRISLKSEKVSLAVMLQILYQIINICHIYGI